MSCTSAISLYKRPKSKDNFAEKTSKKVYFPRLSAGEVAGSWLSPLHRFPALPVGHYRLDVMEEGFSALSRTGITLEVGRAAVQCFLLPAAAGLLQHDPKLLLVCSGHESRRAAGIPDPASDRLWVRAANPFQSAWRVFHSDRRGFTAEHFLSLGPAHRLSVELDD